jgi:hypothetical protein
MYGALFASFPPPPPPEEGQQISALPATVSPSFQVHSHLSAQPPYVLAASHWTCGGGPERSGDRATKRSGDEVMSAPTERAKRKKLVRQSQKDLLIVLDSILHVGDGGEDAPCSAHKNMLEAALGPGPRVTSLRRSLRASFLTCCGFHVLPAITTFLPQIRDFLAPFCLRCRKRRAAQGQSIAGPRARRANAAQHY